MGTKYTLFAKILYTVQYHSHCGFSCGLNFAELYHNEMNVNFSLRINYNNISVSTINCSITLISTIMAKLTVFLL